MSGDQDVAVRVAVRAVIAAAVAGLLVLLFQGRAWADTPQELAEQLANSTQLETAPLAQAEELLKAERRDHWMQLHESVLETGLRFFGSASPRRFLSGGWGIASQLWHWDDRTPAEDRALEWLELEMAAQSPAGADARELYQELLEREREVFIETGLERAEDAIEADQPLLASVRLQNVLDLEPDSEDALELLDRLDTLEAERRPLRDALAPSLDSGSVEGWEAPLAAALLAQDYGRVLEAAPESPSGRFAFSVAQYLSGAPEAALDNLEDLESRADAVGSLARAWLAREDVNVQATLEREARSYKLKRVLGFVGGNQLAEDGAHLSTDMVRAWGDSISPLNVAVSMPARMYRGWRPDGEALRDAALEYIARMPQGERSEEARAWLQEVQPTDPALSDPTRAAGAEAFVLPPSRTTYARLSPSPLVVTRNVLDSVFVSDSGPIREALGASRSVVLEARTDVDPSRGLSPVRARRFLTEVAFALEQGELDALGQGRSATLEGIRRLESALDRGAVLTAEPAEFDSTEMWGTLTRAYIDGEYEAVGALTLSRGRDEFRAERHFGRGGVGCAEGSFCVDRALAVRGTVFTRLDTESNIQVALAAEFQGARMSLSMVNGGPRATLVLPVGRWIGIGAWLPLAAYVRVGADSVYVGPTFSR